MNIKELICVIFGHCWNQSGVTTCMKHDIEYRTYEICSRCKLQKNIGKQYCQQCFDTSYAKVLE